MIHTLHREQRIPAPIEQVWRYFADPQNLNELTPPDMNFKIGFGGEVQMYPGQLIEYRVSFLPGLSSLWLTEIAHVQEGRYFVDEQRIGPYRFWYHEHHFTPDGEGVKMADLVRYTLPYGLLGELVHILWIKGRLNSIFDYRQKVIIDLFGAP